MNRVVRIELMQASLSPLFEFERNTVLNAGAGTGKTETLTSLYLHLVAGETKPGNPVPVERIVAVTFTDKAALEMRERIAGALRWLCLSGQSQEQPTSVRLLEESIGSKVSQSHTELFRKALDSLPSARITTLHGLCVSLLRTYAIESGVDPEFQILNERQHQSLLETSIKDVLHNSLDNKDTEVRNLVQELDGIKPGMERGILPILATLHHEISESGVNPVDLGRNTPVDSAYWSNEFKRIEKVLGVSESDVNRGNLSSAWETLIGSHEMLKDCTEKHSATRKKCAAVSEHAKLLQNDSHFGSTKIEHLLEASETLNNLCGQGAVSKIEKPAQIREAISQLWLLPRAKKHTELLISLLEEIERRYSLTKLKNGVLDFSDMTRLARDLLRDDPKLCNEVSENIGALLVDEFQDTNAIQRDLVYLLHSRNRVHARVPTFSELRNTGLFIVGDRKQSIYGFRGADVAVFQQVSKDLIAKGGQQSTLQTSYRSTPALIRAINLMAHSILRSEGHEDFEFDFDLKTESLEPPRDINPITNETSVELLESNGNIDLDVRKEAKSIAQRAHELVSSHGLNVRTANRVDRAVQYGDMALLLPRFTHLHSYLRAMDDVGVPYIVIRHRGLLKSIEAKDLLNLCSVLTGKDDGLAIFSILRGPMVLVSDPTLAKLVSHDSKARMWLRDLNWKGPWPKEIGEVEKSTLSEALNLLRELRDSFDQAGATECLKCFLRYSGYVAIISGLPSGSERVSNVQRILREISSREYAGEDSRAIIDDLLDRQLYEISDSESPSSMHSTDALQVMTVHQAKGLEFPVVFAADLGRRNLAIRSPVTYDRESNGCLAVSVRSPKGQWIHSPRANQIKAIRAHRERAESKRLFYVQITRARDHLILSGRDSGILQELNKTVFPSLEKETLLQRVTPNKQTNSELPLTLEPYNISSTDLAKKLHPARVIPQTLEVSTTVLEDFTLCARRYRAKHLLRLPEYPRTQPIHPVDADPEILDPRERGTLVHHILQMLDLDLVVKEPEKALQRALHKLGTRSSELSERLEPFIKGTYFRSLASRPILFREVPFALRILSKRVQLIIHGQIDLVSGDKRAVDVIDYKVSAPRGSDPTAHYRFQLDTYALATQRKLSVPVRGGIQFIDGRAQLPVFMPKEFDGSFEKDLIELADRLLDAVQSNRYSGKPLNYCEQIQCGYRWICHSPSSL